VNVAVLGSIRIVPAPDGVTHLVEQFFRLGCHDSVFLVDSVIQL
jgi:hypothetical protein